MKTFKIFKKLNYLSESVEKQNQIDIVCLKIIEKMSQLGYSEVINHDKNTHIDYVFSIGGDGTMLQAMNKHISNKSIVIGINAGNLGFLTPFTIEDVLSEKIFIDNLSYRTEKRSILKGYVSGLSDEIVSVNEMSFYGHSVNSILDFSMEIEYNGQLSKAGHYKANTLIVSGPCGSTAYNMNAGGAIVDPTVRCMQVLMVAPTTIVRPLIIGKNSKIIVNFKNDSKIYVDGNFYKDLKTNDSIEISLVQEEVEVLLPLDWNFYSVLSKKLYWNNGKDV